MSNMPNKDSTLLLIYINDVYYLDTNITLNLDTIINNNTEYLFTISVKINDIYSHDDDDDDTFNSILSFYFTPFI